MLVLTACAAKREELSLPLPLQPHVHVLATVGPLARGGGWWPRSQPAVLDEVLSRICRILGLDPPSEVRDRIGVYQDARGGWIDEQGVTPKPT